MSRGKEKVRAQYEVDVEKLDIDGRGVAHRDGKVVFIEGALPTERVRYEELRSKPSFSIGRVAEILKPSAQRVTPRCPNFGIGPDRKSTRLNSSH